MWRCMVTPGGSGRSRCPRCPKMRTAETRSRRPRYASHRHHQWRQKGTLLLRSARSLQAPIKEKKKKRSMKTYSHSKLARKEGSTMRFIACLWLYYYGAYVQCLGVEEGKPFGYLSELMLHHQSRYPSYLALLLAKIWDTPKRSQLLHTEQSWLTCKILLPSRPWQLVELKEQRMYVCEVQVWVCVWLCRPAERSVCLLWCPFHTRLPCCKGTVF